MSPSPFVAEWVARLAGDRRREARALDVAMGRGRHAIALARAGYATFGVDRRFDAVQSAIAHAAALDIALRAWCADLTMHPLPRRHFDLIVVTRYLQRDLFAALDASLTADGVVLYETFTTAQCARGWGPRSPEHLLEPGELRRRFGGCEVLFYEEVEEPEAVARIAARRAS